MFQPSVIAEDRKSQDGGYDRTSRATVVLASAGPSNKPRPPSQAAVGLATCPEGMGLLGRSARSISTSKTSLQRRP